MIIFRDVLRYRIVLKNGKRIEFNTWYRVKQYLNKNSLRIDYNDGFGYWGIEGGGHITSTKYD